jgi:Zn-dependent protease
MRKGIFWVSFAGALSNLILGTLSAMILAIIVTQVSTTWAYFTVALRMLQYSIFINFLLAFFNLIPLPPLDGSQMVGSFLKGNALRKYEELARYTPGIMIGLLVLSFVFNIHVLSYILRPAEMIANFVMFEFISLFGGLG